MLKMKDVIDQAIVPASLFRATVRQYSGNWEDFLESAQDIATFGASEGVGGFVYYSETVPFAKRQRENILNLASRQANDLGMLLVDFFKSFGCFRELSRQDIETCLYQERIKDKDLETIWYNGLAWYALEEIARTVTDFTER